MHTIIGIKYVYTKPLLYNQDVTHGQFLRRGQLVWILSFPFHRLVAEIRIAWSKTQASASRIRTHITVSISYDDDGLSGIPLWFQVTPLEYKTRHDWVGKVIHRKLCKRWKFDHSTKWYMYKIESVRENETHKIVSDFEIQTDLLIPTWKPDLEIINEKKKRENLPHSVLCCSIRLQSGNQGKRKERQALGHCVRTK